MRHLTKEDIAGLFAADSPAGAPRHARAGDAVTLPALLTRRPEGTTLGAPPASAALGLLPAGTPIFTHVSPGNPCVSAVAAGSWLPTGRGRGAIAIARSV